MTIAPGARVGFYEVGELIGEGGMGTVYRGRDLRLEREVAIKVIREDLARDADRVARFDRESRLLASLNHPNIATVYGLEHTGQTRVLVLELVPGLTLAQRLNDGRLTVTESIEYALQMAAGIAAAHEQGIIHRDLKPANVKITATGAIKILDFGLAKALAVDSNAQAVAFSSTLTSGGTAEGVIVGTAAYMSPEQARGKEVDRRTDIWAFGCVLYDMLAGRTAFGADTLSDTIAAILTRDPDWALLPEDVPASVRRLLRRCLQKDASRRLRDINDARLDLEEALLPAESVTAAGGLSRSAGRAGFVRSPVRAALLVTGLLGAAVLGAVSYAALHEETPEPVRTAHFSVALPGDTRLDGLDFPAVALAPDDARVTFVATRGGSSQLFVRPLASLEAQPLTGTEGALAPFFSPDGNWIAFFASGKLRKVPAAGGPVVDIADAEIGFGGVWGRDNMIVFAPNNASELMRVPADGGTPEPITTLDRARGEFSHRWPELLPDGTSVLFTAGTAGSWDDAEIVLQRIGSSERRTLVHGGTAPRFAAGHVLYVRAGILHALPFDAGQQQATGETIADLGEVLESIDGAGQVAVSRNGSVVYVPGAPNASMRTMAWVDRGGRPQPLAAPPRAYCCPRLSSDDARIAVTIAGTPANVFTYDIARDKLDQVTFAGGASPTWASDGRLVFASTRGGTADLFVKHADASGTEERLTEGPKPRVPFAVSADGAVLFVENDETGRDIGVLDRDGAVRQLVASPANEYAPALSPDGRWLAYVSDRTGVPEVVVAPYADPSRVLQVSKGGGSEPLWRRDGGELYFRNGDAMMVASIRTRPGLAVPSVSELFRAHYDTGAAGRPAYDLSHDGARFLMMRPTDAVPPGRELRVILGWRP